MRLGGSGWATPRGPVPGLLKRQQRLEPSEESNDKAVGELELLERARRARSTEHSRTYEGVCVAQT